MGSHAITYAVVALAIAAVCLIAGFSWGRSNVKAQIEQAVEKEHVALDAREFAMRTQLEDSIAEVAKLRPLAEELGRTQKRLEREQAKYAQLKAEFNSAMGLASEPLVPDETEAQLLPPTETADEAIQKLLQSLEVFNDPNAPAATEPVLNSTPPPEPSTAPVAAPLAPPTTSRPVEEARPAQVSKPAEVARVAAPPLPAAPLPQAKQPVPPPIPKTGSSAPMAPPQPAAPKPQAQPQPPKPASAEPRKPMPTPPSKSAGTEAAKPGRQVDEWQEFARELEALTGKKKQA